MQSRRFLDLDAGALGKFGAIYGLAIEMLIHNDNLHQGRAGPSP